MKKEGERKGYEEKSGIKQRKGVKRGEIDSNLILETNSLYKKKLKMIFMNISRPLFCTKKHHLKRNN